MLGALIGDIAGSRFEFHNHRDKQFDLFTEECFVTDDSIMTLAVAKALMEAVKRSRQLHLAGPEADFQRQLSELTVQYMQEIGRAYPESGYGGMFEKWLFSEHPLPYHSFGNGAAMRVSAAGYLARSEKEAEQLAETVTAVTHNHPEGIKGATAVASAIYLARKGASKNEIQDRISQQYYSMDFHIDDIRSTYRFNETCQDTVPQAIKCFLESTSFEDTIRTAVSLGGDSDTIAAIAGSIAEAYFGVPESLREQAFSYLDEDLLLIYQEWTAFLSTNNAKLKLVAKDFKASHQLEAVILFPEFKELKESVEKLRTELSMLVLERDELLYVECKNIEMKYLLFVGGLVFKLYEMECLILRLKRKIELAQARKNRQEPIDFSKIEATLDQEFAEYQARLREQLEQMNAALEWKQGEWLSEKETRELKKLYRAIVKALHPDLHPEQSQEKLKLFYSAVSAYEKGDAASLRIIFSMVGEPSLLEEDKSGIAHLKKEKERLSEQLQSIKNQILKIKASYPYTLKSFVQDSEQIAARTSELEEQIHRYKEVLANYQVKMKEVLS